MNENGEYDIIHYETSASIVSYVNNSQTTVEGALDALFSGKADTSHSHAYLPTAGGTMTGALTFANNTWNNVGDDVAIGDINQGGKLGIKGLNGTTGIRVFNGESQSGFCDLTYNGGKLNASGGLQSAGTNVSVEGHNHAGTNITSGTVAPARLPYTYSTTDLTAGSSALTTGYLYFVYE